MSHIEPSRLRRFLLDDRISGILFMLIWSELEENSEAHRALSKVLFGEDGVDNPDDALRRDLSDLSKRLHVANCVAKYPEIYAAAERVICEIEAGSDSGC
jgi:hypothetical protein